jgi:hypothetical protein
MAIYRTRVSALAAKIEGTSGTDAVPTLVANAVRFVGVPVLAIAYLDAGARDDVIFGGMGKVARQPAVGRNASITIRMEMRGTGTTYAAAASTPEVDPFLRAAGFAPTNTAATWVYSSLDDGFETMTLYCWTRSKLFKLVGCVVHARLIAVTNDRAFWEFTVNGVMLSDPTQTVLGAITANATIPPVFVNSAVTIGALNYAGGLLVRRLEWDNPITFTARPAAGAPDGLVGYAITDRSSHLTMQIEQVPLATLDPYALSKASGAGTGNAGSAQIGVVGSFNGLLLEWGQWMIEAPGEPDTGGIADWSLEGDLVANSLAANTRESRLTFN